MRSRVRKFLCDESGAAAIEVGLIAAGLCVAFITLAGHMGDDVKVLFERLRDMLRSFELRSLA